MSQFEMVTLMATQILNGHKHGVLSVSWYRQDVDLSLSRRKENHAVCWNPQALETIGKVRSFLVRLIDTTTHTVIAPNSEKPRHSGFLGVHGI